MKKSYYQSTFPFFSNHIHLLILKSLPVLLVFLSLSWTVELWSQDDNVIIKDRDDNVLLKFNDDGSTGSITFFPSTTALGDERYKLYNLNNELIWHGAKLATESEAAGWRFSSPNIFLQDNTFKVGIGTASPLAKVHILQESTLPAFKVDDQASDPTPFVIDDIGNVGIGTASPVLKVHVLGDIRLEDSSSPTFQFYLDDIYAAFLGVLNSELILNQRRIQPMKFRTSNTDRMTIDASGNIGIGTITPSHKLEIAGKLKLGDDTATESAGVMRFNTGTNEFEGYNGTSWLSFGSGGKWLSNGNEIYYNLDNVGIGNNNPGFPLEVTKNSTVNTINPVATFRTVGGNSSGSIRLQNSADNYWVIGATQDPDNAFGINYNQNNSLSSDLLRITPTGNIGIGTASPSDAFELVRGPYNIKMAHRKTQSGSEDIDSIALAVFNHNTYAYLANKFSGTGSSGMYGLRVNSTGADSNFGIRASASGGAYSVGIYASASGGFFDNYAGSFDGQVRIQGNLNVIGDGNVGIGLSNPSEAFELVRGPYAVNMAQRKYDMVTGITDSVALAAINHNTYAYLADIEVETGGALFKNHGIKVNAIGGDYNYGILASASGGFYSYGIRASASGGGLGTYAGYFEGDVRITDDLQVQDNLDVDGDLDITGTLSKGSGSFKIDHPLDPENKYLYHSFVESPDMMNVYNGNIFTDEDGYATVELPSYFEGLNKDFRYQLTVIGEFAQAIISKKISDNQFEIRTDKPHIEVSWQVTGIRNDAYARMNRIQVEVDKKPEDRGTYIHPEAFSKSIRLKEGNDR